MTADAFKILAAVSAFTALAAASGCTAERDEMANDRPEATEDAVLPAEGAVATTEQALRTCTSVSSPPASAGFTYSGDLRVRLPNGLTKYCVGDDGITRTGPSGALTYGKLTTSACSASSPRWSIYQSPGYVAFCKPGTLKKCTTDNVLYHYFAQCAFTAATVTGDAEIAEYTLSIQSGSSWSPTLTFGVDTVAVPYGLAGHYLTDRNRTTKRFLTRSTSGSVIPDLRYMLTGTATQQLWDAY